MKTFFLIIGYNLLFLSYGQFGIVKYSEKASNHFTLFHPHNNPNTYLIDSEGYLVHEWKGKYPPGNTVTLLPNKLLFRTGKIENNTFHAGGLGGYLELIDYQQNILWSYQLSNESEAFHHEAIVMENGNILAIVWERVSKNEAIQMGRKPEFVNDQGFWSEKIIEIKPIGEEQVEIIWEWNVKDHLIQTFDVSKDNYSESLNPERLDINYVTDKSIVDWIHLNSIHYSMEHDLILLSSPFFNEIWIIDHSTTTEQAKTSSGGTFNRGGDILYRWGNPETYNQGTEADKKLFGQHNAQLISKGDELGILLYNNGVDRPQGEYSTIDYIKLPFLPKEGFNKELNIPYEPTEVSWSLSAKQNQDFYSRIVSGVQLLPNGNFFVTEGIKGRLFEIDSASNILWQYESSHGSSETLTADFHCEMIDTFNPSIIFRATKYPIGYSGIEPDLDPIIKLEEKNCPLSVHAKNEKIQKIDVFSIDGKKLGSFNSTNELKDLPKNQLLILKNHYGKTIKTQKIVIQ